MCPSCAVVSYVVINSELRRFGNMTVYQREVLNVEGKYVSILLNSPESSINKNRFRFINR